MKTKLVTLCTILASCLAASAPTGASAQADAPLTVVLSQENYFDHDDAHVPSLGGLVLKPVIGPIGVFANFSVSQPYSEAYVGPMLSPLPWLTLGVGLGIEQDEHPTRFGSIASVNTDVFTSIAYFEYGGSGTWFRVEAIAIPHEHIGIGAMAQAVEGVGPRFEMIDIAGSGITAFVSSMYLLPKSGITQSLLLGVRAVLQ